MKRLMTALLAFALMLSLASCKTQPSAEGDYSEVYAAISAYQKTHEDAIFNSSPYMRDGTDFLSSPAEAINTIDDATAAEAYSKTNTQVAGIDEGDRVKTDGKYVYYLSGNKVRIYSAEGEESKLIGCTELKLEGSFYISHMYVSNGVLMLLTYSYDSYDTDINEGASERTTVYYYDVTDPTSPSLVTSAGQDGWLSTSRLYDGKLYLLTSYAVVGDIDEDEPKTYVPRFYNGTESALADCGCICIPENVSSTSYTVIAAYDAENGELLSQCSVLGAGSTIYMSGDNLYIASMRDEENKTNERTEGGYTVYDYSYRQYTDILRIRLSDLSVAADGTVEGCLDSQFSMDEKDGYLRLVTTAHSENETYSVEVGHDFASMELGEAQQSSSLYILDSDLSAVSSINGLAEDEQIYSVRFDGDIAYFCSFRQVDPLFAADLSDPTAPKILSELKISGFSDYLHDWSDDRLFGIGLEADEATGQTQELKLVMFDTSDKTDVTVKHSRNLSGIYYTAALSDHTALMISPERGIIGFGVGDGYHIFTYSDADGFVEAKRLSFGGVWGEMRAVYVDDNAYIVSELGMKVVSLNDYGVICSVDVK